MNRMRTPAGVVAALALLSCSAGLAGCGPNGASPKDLKPWVLSGVTLQLPAKPEKMDITLPPEVRSKVLLMENHQVRLRNFEAGLSKVVYAPGIEANAEGALEGALSNVAKTQNMSRGALDKKAVTVSGLNGLRYTAQFKKSGQDVETQGMILAKASGLWQVFTVYLKSNSDSREAATKIVDSIQIVP